ncbi:uncharacterized protein LOC116430533 [Nomia melanderi]|uniref:uncharacterized protein LOC116430533 n=1 Tax=Nomia melanderi TaxID=2448451 RepID=UPI0013041071|nr:uncharacterized protein LOC116430533 [Nomia melanderi]
MSHINQDEKYVQLAHKLLKVPAMSTSKLILRHLDHSREVPTEMIQELGTTDVAIGDVTAEVMITTLGKIPNEMYYIEDTTPIKKLAVFGNNHQGTSEYEHAVISSTEITKSGHEHGYSPLLVSLLCALVVILFMCCVTACIIAKSKRKINFFNKECEPGCTGMSQPLLDKISECSNKPSISTLRN